MEMFLHSDRKATVLVDAVASNTEIKTLKDFLRIVKSGDVWRAEIDHITTYRSNFIGSGSQFTIFDERGLRLQGLPSAVIKCPLFHLSPDKVFPETKDRRVTTDVDLC